MPQQTGPTTLEGKAVTCLNAITHGGTSRKLFVPGENPDDFFNLLAEFFTEYQPGSLSFSSMVTDLAHARWYLWRRQRSSDAAEFELHTAKPDETTWTTEDFHRLQLFDRYKTEAERALQRALRNVHAAQKNAARERNWQENLESQKQRFAGEAERFKRKQEQESQKASKDLAQTRNEARLAEKAFQRSMDSNWANSMLGRETYMGQTVYSQHILVRSHGGVAETTFYRTNDWVRWDLDMVRTNMLINDRPEAVARRYFFEGPVPPEYRWLVNDEKDANRCDFQTVSVLPFETWYAIAEKEDALTKLQALNHKEAKGDIPGCKQKCSSVS